MMRQTLSEFAGCKDWDVEELCRFIDKLHAQVVGRVKVVRCRDCKHATINIYGVCKYCELLWLPDVDGYGADPQVNLPGDFYCPHCGAKAGAMSEQDTREQLKVAELKTMNNKEDNNER